MDSSHGIGASGETSLAARIEQTPHALTARELGSLLGLGRSAVYQLAQAGRIPSLRLGTTIRFDPLRIAAWLRQREVAAPEESSG
jgi:excisionase family DNA binding protein